MSRKTSFIKRFLYWLEGKFPNFWKSYKFKVVETIPEKLEKRTVYIERLEEKDYEMDFLCPFKCGEVIQLNMDKNYHPFWTTNFKDTITPSIDVQDKCRCHYFIRNGKIRIAK